VVVDHDGTMNLALIAQILVLVLTITAWLAIIWAGSRHG